MNYYLRVSKDSVTCTNTEMIIISEKDIFRKIGIYRKDFTRTEGL